MGTWVFIICALLCNVLSVSNISVTVVMPSLTSTMAKADLIAGELLPPVAKSWGWPRQAGLEVGFHPSPPSASRGQTSNREEETVEWKLFLRFLVGKGQVRMRLELVPQLVWCVSECLPSATVNPSEWKSGPRRLLSGLFSRQDKAFTSKCLLIPYYKMGKLSFYFFVS